MTETQSEAFAKHKAAENDTPKASRGAKMPWVGRFLIFVFVPTFTGITGLGVSYLQALRNDQLDEGEEPHEVDFDRDFVTPFLLAMALVIVLGFQTGGFRTRERKAAFAWPTARTVQRVRHERVVVDDPVDKKEQ